jgi:hypothetical protein
VQRGGYLFLPGFSFLYDVIHGWMTRWMDGRDEKASRKTITTSFNIWGAGDIVTEITREKIIDGDGDGSIARENPNREAWR